jgi:hypothetical protein
MIFCVPMVPHAAEPEAAGYLPGADATESHSGPTSAQPAYEAGQSGDHNDALLAKNMHDCQRDWSLAESCGLLLQNEIEQGIEGDHLTPCPVFDLDLLEVARRLMPNLGDTFDKLDLHVPDKLRQRLNPANSKNRTGSCNPVPPALELVGIIFTPYDQRSDQENRAMDRNRYARVPSLGWKEARRRSNQASSSSRG